MPVLTFRTSVANATPAKTPASIDLISGARAVQEVIIWSNTTTLDISKTGMRLLDRGSGRILIPEAGSWGQENFIAAGANEENGWAPIMSGPMSIDMNEQVIEGPPYKITIQFYNTAAAAILIAGYVVVREPFARIPDSSLYEFMTPASNPGNVALPTTQGINMERPVK